MKSIEGVKITLEKGGRWNFVNLVAQKGYYVIVESQSRKKVIVGVRKKE